MITRFDMRRRSRAILLAFMFSLALLFVLPHAGTAQAVHEFQVTVDPLTSCATNAPVTGTVTLIGLTPGYEFSVQLRGDGDLIDSQAFQRDGGYPDGAYEWSVAGDLTGSHEVLELSFTLHNGELDLIRNETVVLNPDCALFQSEASPTPGSLPGSPVTNIPTTGAATVSSPEPAVTSLPATGDDPPANVVTVAGFAAATVLILTALAVLDRRPEL